MDEGSTPPWLKRGDTPRPPRPAGSKEIGGIWDEAKRLREEESLLEVEYQLAKERAKQLKKQLKKHYLEDDHTLLDASLGHAAAHQNTTVKIAKTSKKQHARMLATKLRTHVHTPKLPSAKYVAATGGLALVFVIVASLANQSSSHTESPQQKSASDARSGVLSESTAKSYSGTKYLPTALPQGYSGNDIKIITPDKKADGKVYTYTIPSTDPHNNVFVSIQPLPKNLDLDAFEDELEGRIFFQAPIGHATIGTQPETGLWIASVRTNSDWLLLNANPTVSLQDLRYIVSNLKSQ